MCGCLGGSVGWVSDSWSQGCEFKFGIGSHKGHEAYLKKKKRKKKEREGLGGSVGWDSLSPSISALPPLSLTMFLSLQINK